MKTKAHKWQIRKFLFYKALSQGALLMAFAALAAVILFILIRGLPYVNGHLLFGRYDSKSPTIGPALAGTMYLILLSVAIAAPIGIGSAIFLAEYTKTKSRLLKTVRVAVETLAGIPSIVYGIFGYLVFVVMLRLRYSLLGGGVTLAIMILPLIIRGTEESLLAVPRSLREGSFALGSSKLRTVFSVVLPCAASGIVTSLILSIGRIISESAVLILTIGMVVDRMPKGLLSSGTSLALDVYYFSSHGYPEQAAATGVVLLALVVCVNALATVLGRAFGKGELVNG